MATPSPSLSSDDRASASTLELTQKCISLFEGCVALSKNARSTAMETRLADVRLWADGVGAIADGRASLDWRFHSREQDLLLVKTILIMLADFVEDYATLLAEEQPADDALERIDSTIENLALIGVAIRRTGKASRRRRADTRFDPEDYEELRQHLECVILLRPSKSGLPDQLNPSTLTMVQKRLIEANLKRRHRFVIAQKRFRKVEGASRQRRNASVSQDDTTSKGGGKEADPQSNKASGARRNQGDGQQAPTTKGGLTAASTAEGTLQYGKRRRYVPGAARTQITALAADAEFPRPPPNPEGRRIGKCPCCCQSLLVEEMMDSSKWRQHIVEDLLPYTCMVEDCPTPHTAVFSTRKEWEAHAKTDHRAQWRCPLCEEENFVVESKDEIVHHFSTEHQDDLKELTLETLLPWSEAQSMGISSCPVCSSYGREDSPEIIDHVLKHVYEFSLRALPWTKPITHDLTTPIGTFRVPSDEGLAERLLEWVDEAEGHTAHEFQLSAVEADNYGTDILGGIEDTGYVPDDEYFDAESAAKSSRPQLADSELFDDFFGPYEIPPPAPDPPRLLDPDDFTDVPFPLPSSSNRGDESDDDIQVHSMEDILDQAMNYIQSIRANTSNLPPSAPSPPDSYESSVSSDELEDPTQPHPGMPSRIPSFRPDRQLASWPDFTTSKGLLAPPGSTREEIATWLDDTAQEVDSAEPTSSVAPHALPPHRISPRQVRVRQRPPPRRYPSTDSVPRHTVSYMELVDSSYETSSYGSLIYDEDDDLVAPSASQTEMRDDGEAASAGGQNFIAGHPQSETDRAPTVRPLHYYTKDLDTDRDKQLTVHVPHVSEGEASESLGK